MGLGYSLNNEPDSLAINEKTRPGVVKKGSIWNFVELIELQLCVEVSFSDDGRRTHLPARLYP